MHSRLGFVHVPKCGGTSIANAIFAAAGMENFHIARLVDRNATFGTHDVIRDHVSFRLARAMPFLSGHITYSDMRDLHRDVIFAVLRDPYAVALSHFTYRVRRARDPKILARHPHLAPYKTRTLAEHLEQTTPGHFLSALAKDVMTRGRVRDIARADRSALDANSSLQREIDRALQRFDFVMAGDVSRQVASLKRYAELGDIVVGHRNKSPDSLRIVFGASRQAIMMHLKRLCWLDNYVYDRCAVLFPDTMTPRIPNVETAIDAFIARFDPQDV